MISNHPTQSPLIEGGSRERRSPLWDLIHPAHAKFWFGLLAGLVLTILIDFAAWAANGGMFS